MSGWFIQLWEFNDKRKRGCRRTKKEGSDFWYPLNGPDAERVASLFDHRRPHYGNFPNSYFYVMHDKYTHEDVIYESSTRGTDEAFR